MHKNLSLIDSCEIFIIKYKVNLKVRVLLRVKKLTEEERLTLENMKKNHPSNLTRMRAHAILLSDIGFRVQELAEIFGACRQTTATWLRVWDKKGICGLLDKPRSGRPRKMLLEINI